MADSSPFCHHFLIYLPFFNHLYQDPLQCFRKNAGLSLEGFLEARTVSSPSYSTNYCSSRKSTKSTEMATCRKLVVAVRLLYLTVAANLLLLSNDVSTNPGPMDNLLYSPEDSSFSSIDSEEELPGLFTGSFNESSSTFSDFDNDILHANFDLALDEKGIRIGHWNVNHLTLDKYDQIKLLLLGKFGKPQLDVLFINESFLKPNVLDILYEVPGYSIYRRDRTNKSGGGVMAYINDDLNAKRRTDLESQELEVIWFEVCPFKSKRSLLIGSIYRPPSYTKAEDLSLEANLEQVYLLNKETFLGDMNINGMNKESFDKLRLIKAVHGVNFKQLLNEVTRPVSGTCLDHIYSNHPQGITNIFCRNIGLSDHLPIFAVRKYSKDLVSRGILKNNSIRYGDMKRFNENQFKETLSQAP